MLRCKIIRRIPTPYDVDDGVVLPCNNATESNGESWMSKDKTISWNPKPVRPTAGRGRRSKANIVRVARSVSVSNDLLQSACQSVEHYLDDEFMDNLLKYIDEEIKRRKEKDTNHVKSTCKFLT